MAIACAGYRVKGQGHHKTMFEALPLALGPGSQKTADFFEQCRRSRNIISYDAAGIVSPSQAAAVLSEALAFGQTVEAWITAHHPTLNK